MPLQPREFLTRQVWSFSQCVSWRSFFCAGVCDCCFLGKCKVLSTYFISFLLEIIVCKDCCSVAEFFKWESLFVKSWCDENSTYSILRTFSIKWFSQGPCIGPELLLRTLRGDVIDWKQIEDDLMSKAFCRGCNIVKYKEDFKPRQWIQIDNRFCRTCVLAKENEGTPHWCTNRGTWKSMVSMQRKASNNRLHKKDVETKWCRAQVQWMQWR